MAFKSDTRTTHMWSIDIPDDILGRLQVGDSVEVILFSREGNTSVKRLTYRDIQSIADPYHKGKSA